jgi:iron complex outermembrane recepter protein
MTLRNLILATTALTLFASQPALAQASEEGVNDNAGEIIVTARRRDETAQQTPVALTVLNDVLLERYGVKGIATIAQLTPGLFTGETSGAMGGSISLRGVGSGESMAFIDQAVSVNVDGVPISSAQILRAAQMDLKQIEVLRGPQALFFGKNSPGGIISLTTADPGKGVEGLVRGGYEFKADEWYLDGTISAPLGDTGGVRLAGHYSKMKGYVRINSPVLPGVNPSGITRFPKQDEFFLRGTVAFEPSDSLKVRLKGTYTDTKMVGSPSNFSDIVACPYGVSQRPGEGNLNCANDGEILLAQLPASYLALSPLLENPDGSRSNKQVLLSGQIDVKLGDSLTLTSVTGYYNVKERTTSNGGYGPYSNNAFAVRFNSDQVSEELRLASKFDGALNFLVGGFYESRNLYTLTYIAVPFGGNFLTVPPAPTSNFVLPLESTNQHQTSTSVFGQAMLDLSPQIQLTAGGRYTHEVKNLKDFTVNGTDVTKQATYPGGPNPKLVFNNFSPEVTMTYKPHSDMMLFASWKRGFKSGGFDAGFTNGAILTPLRQSLGQTFRPEKVEGAEIGLKSSWADRQITFNVTGYWYDYKDLQVSVFDTTARAFHLENAAKARVKGIEIETSYRPRSTPGLNFHASAAFNDAKYRQYIGDCYAGQTVALGCNQALNAVSGLFTAQDLSGRRLRKAPAFAATLGGYYEFPVSTGMMMSIGADGSYSSSYNVGTQLQPIAMQKGFAKLDATMRLFSEDKRWELALIGRNLTNKRNLVNGIDRTGTGGAKGSTTASCTAAGQAGCIATADLIGTPALPRTVSVQATFKY